MSKSKLILVPSTKMDSNKKPDRNEHMLVRMSAVTRQAMGFESKVEVFADDDTEKRMKSAMLLDIFHAFADDIKKLKDEGFTPEELRRVGFVTTKTFQRITGAKDNRPHKNIWISDKPDNTIVGADPEFLLFNANGGVVRANNVLSYQGPLGCDGAMAEIRPKPAMTALELVDNMRSILKSDKNVPAIKDYRWMAGCYYQDEQRDYPLGGHIHIGNPVQIAQLSTKQREGIFSVMNKILDELIAIPMVKIDGAELGRARRTECKMGKYGYFGEWRPCNGRLEWRTLSGMWLMHPKLAECVIGASKAVTDEIFKILAENGFKPAFALPQKFEGECLWNPKFSGWGQMPLAKEMDCIRSSADMIELLHKSSANKITVPFLKNWYARMRKLTTYGRYSKEIDGLYEILKNNTKTFHEFDKEIKANWLGGRKFIGE